jgi:hypothetical protein
MNCDKPLDGSKLKQAAPLWRSSLHFRAAMLALGAAIQFAGTGSAMAADPAKPALASDRNVAAMSGHYYLQGVHEVGAELLLRPDGRFQFAMSYGAVDQSAEGTWAQRAKKIVLTTDKQPEPSFSWNQEQPALDERCFAEPDEPTLLAVCINTPSKELAWSGVEITAEFANGRQRSGTTGRGGQLHFVARDEPEWKDVPVTRIKVAYPYYKAPAQWFEVPRGARTALVNFEPGRLVGVPFEKATLRIVSSGTGEAALVMLDDDGKAEKGRYVRR